MLRFEFTTDRLEAYKDSQGKMHIRGIASDNLEDLQRDRISLSALKKMVRQCKKGIPLLPQHKASFEIGMSTGAELRENKQTGATEMVVDYLLYDQYPQAQTLFKEALAQECWRQLSIGGMLNEHARKPAYLEETADGRVIRVLNDLILDHIAVTRANMAANPRTGFVDAMYKSLDENGFSIDEKMGVLEKGEKYVTIPVDETEDDDPGRKFVEENSLTAQNNTLNIPSDAADKSKPTKGQRQSAEESQMGDDLLKATVTYKAWPLAAEAAWDWNAAKDGNTLLGDDLDNWSRFKQAHTYYDESLGSTPAVKSAYSLPHHKLTDGGMKTYISGVQRAVAALNGARGGFRRDTSPEGRMSLYNHLRKHYEQAGRTAPPLKKEWLGKIHGKTIPTKWGAAVEKDYEDFVSSLQSVGEAIPEWLTLKWWTTWDESVTGLNVPPAEEKGVWTLPVEKSEEAKEGPETGKAGTMQTPEERTEADRLAAEKAAQEKADAEKQTADDKANSEEKAKTDADAKAEEERLAADVAKAAEEAAKAREEDAKKEKDGDSEEKSDAKAEEKSDETAEEKAEDVEKKEEEKAEEATEKEEEKKEEEKSEEKVEEKKEETAETEEKETEDKGEEKTDDNRLSALEQSVAQLAASMTSIAQAVKSLASDTEEETKTEEKKEDDAKADEKQEEKLEEKSTVEHDGAEENKDDDSEQTTAQQAGDIFSSFKAVAEKLMMSEKDALEQLMDHYGVKPVTADDLAKSVSSLIEKSSTNVEQNLTGKIDDVVKNLGDLTQRLEKVEKVNGSSRSIDGQESDQPANGGGVFGGIFMSAAQQAGNRR